MHGFQSAILAELKNGTFEPLHEIQKNLQITVVNWRAKIMRFTSLKGAECYLIQMQSLISRF